MAFTTVAQVEAKGGLDDATSFNLFWYANKPALDAEVQDSVNLAAAWVATRAGAAVYAAAALDADLTAIFARGETYIALHFLMPALQSRKVMGTHYPLQQEDSERFEQLIGTQWMELASDLLEPYLTVELEQKPFAMPVFILGNFVDDSPANTALDGEDVIAESIADRARAFSVGP